jgi:glycosyltransferase involved in cell wall biosynthesis
LSLNLSKSINQMNLLFLTPQLPYPPRQGTTIRNYYLIKHLAQRHQIDLLTFLAPGEQLTADSPLHQLCRRIATVAQPVRSLRQRGLDTLTSPLPDMALRLEHPAMHRLIEQWVADTPYDLVQSEGIEMAQYGMQVARPAHIRPERGARSQPRLIFDDHNCEYLLQKRNALTDLRLPRRWLAAAYSLVQWQKLRLYEARICCFAAATLAVSEADQRALQALLPGLGVTIVSNGIELAEYPVLSPPRPAPPFTLVFTGKMDYRPNIDAMLWFGRHVLPLVQAQVPQVRLQIVGMNPSPRLDELRANPAIAIVGAVPDTRPYIHAAAVYLIPMRVGGGTRFKALEAMASGKSIVSTTLGIEGIPVQDGRELLLADRPDTFAAQVLLLLRDQQDSGQVSAALGIAARRFVERHYGWPQILPRLEQVYADVLVDRPAT